MASTLMINPMNGGLWFVVYGLRLLWLGFLLQLIGLSVFVDILRACSYKSFLNHLSSNHQIFKSPNHFLSSCQTTLTSFAFSPKSRHLRSPLPVIPPDGAHIWLQASSTAMLYWSQQGLLKRNTRFPL